MTVKGKFGEYDKYTISNGELEMEVTTIGACILSLKYKGIERVVSYKTPEDALKGTSYLCKGVGRYANRIGGASFMLDGVRYNIPANENGNALHGGTEAFDSRVWQAEADDTGITFSIFSPDGDNGFPGNLTMTVRYELCGSTLKVLFGGETDKPTVFSPTVHPYFTCGEDYNVLNAQLQLFSDGHTEVDSALIPTGVILPCEGKYDFAQMRAIGEDLDDCFVISQEHACTVNFGDALLDVWTDFPAVQVYTGLWIHPPFKPNCGLAIEPEFYPDSPNHAQFPTTVLRPGEKFSKYCEYRFSEL